MTIKQAEKKIRAELKRRIKAFESLKNNGLIVDYRITKAEMSQTDSEIVMNFTFQPFSTVKYVEIII